MNYFFFQEIILNDKISKRERENMSEEISNDRAIQAISRLKTERDELRRKEQLNKVYFMFISFFVTYVASIIEAQ